MSNPMTPRRGQPAKRGYAHNKRRKWTGKAGICPKCKGEGVRRIAGQLVLCLCSIR